MSTAAQAAMAAERAAWVKEASAARVEYLHPRHGPPEFAPSPQAPSPPPAPRALPGPGRAGPEPAEEGTSGLAVVVLRPVGLDRPGLMASHLALVQALQNELA